jgi:hypothetical protein
LLLGAGKHHSDQISRTEITFERAAVIESPYPTHLRFRVNPAKHPPISEVPQLS